ncbi:MAG: tRNA (guanosine(46)-N7)-methyltransferase TrmB [Aquificota bacterium]|nr:tRNA (guanosine(46)-N7)-methyltransferase TrmB [Aquificota bacterium]
MKPFPLINHFEVPKPLPFRDLLVEIGFGRGEFIVRLARENPGRIVLGVEISGVSVEKLLKRIKRESITNIRIVHMDAYWCFNLLLEDSSVERIYMNYPDPWFKKRHIKRRLTKEENLYIFARRLKPGGEIVIRTDHYPFIEYTLEQAENLKVFSSEVRRLSVEDPLTKYEERWVSMGKEIYELKLVRSKEPEQREVRTIREVEEVFPVKVQGREPCPEEITGEEIRLGEGVYLKFFRVYRADGVILVETLLSEFGFLQKLFIEIRRKGDCWVVDVSPFSQVLRTDNLQRAVELMAERGFRP